MTKVGLISIAFSQSLMASSNFSRVFKTAAPNETLVIHAISLTISVECGVLVIKLDGFRVAFEGLLVILVHESLVSKFLHSF